jgi:hypothetical protein
MSRNILNREEMISKWESAKGKISIKDINDPYVRENIAVLLENQERKDWNGKDIFCETAQAANTTASLSQMGYTFPAGTQDTDAWRFRPVALALVRRTFPELFANKVVGVQALSTPVGLAYALRVVYNDGNNVEAAWDNVPEYGGYTGSDAQTSAALDTTYAGYDTSGTGMTTSAAEAWQIEPSGSYPQLKMRIDKVSIEAATRKLAASFSLESAQDIKAMHDIDIEREMLNVIQYESIAELDRELLYRMKKASVNTANGGATITAINCSGTSALDGRWSQERYANIVAAIINQANNVAIKTRRGPGNFVIVSPQIATVLQASGHPFTRLHSAANATTTVAEIGVLNDTITVYRDVYAQTDYALVGFKGSGISDCGIIFSPYIMGLTSKAIDPTDFSPRIGVMARYAITDTLLGSGRYYRLLPFTNVSSIIAGAV